MTPLTPHSSFHDANLPLDIDVPLDISLITPSHSLSVRGEEVPTSTETPHKIAHDQPLTQKTLDSSARIARVLPFKETAHLDRLFDYHIPDTLDVVPGQLVKVPFARSTIQGIVYEIVDHTDYSGKTLPLLHVISPVIMLDEKMRILVEKVAQRYAGTRMDVIRFVLPSYHKTAEKEFFSHYFPDHSPLNSPLTTDAALSHLCAHHITNTAAMHDDYLTSTSNTSHTGNTRNASNTTNISDISSVTSKMDSIGYCDPKEIAADTAMLQLMMQSTVAIRNGSKQSTPETIVSSRIMWLLHPQQSWMKKIALAIEQCLSQSLRVLVIVPTVAIGKLLNNFLSTTMPEVNKIFLDTTKAGKRKYRSWLQAHYGFASVIIGMRHGVYASVPDLGAIIMFDDSDDNYSEPLSPYPHTRTVAIIRSVNHQCALILLGYSRCAEVQALCDSSWAFSYTSPVVSSITVKALNSAACEDPMIAYQRIPREVFSTVHQTLEAKKPVLIHVHHKGFSEVVFCSQCQTPVRCRSCNGSLFQKDTYEVYCRWCHKIATHIRCMECGSSKIKFLKPGAKRTAKELGQAFHPYQVIYSADDNIQRTIAHKPIIVIATTGAEPYVSPGYGAVIFLDIWPSLLRNDLRASEKTFHTIMNCMSLVAPQGTMVIAADIAIPLVHAAVTQRALVYAREELEKRHEVNLPPWVRLATIDGQGASINHFISLCDFPPDVEKLGPVPMPFGVDPLNESTFGDPLTAERLLIKSPLSQAYALSSALKHARIQYSMQSKYLPVRVMVDPLRVG